MDGMKGEREKTQRFATDFVIDFRSNLVHLAEIVMVIHSEYRCKQYQSHLPHGRTLGSRAS